MNDLRPTPETDANLHEWHHGFQCMERSAFGDWVPADEARKIERERDEAIMLVRMARVLLEGQERRHKDRMAAMERIALRMVEIFDESGDEITARQFRSAVQYAMADFTVAQTEPMERP